METGERACLDPVTWFESLARLSEWVAIGAPLENALRLAHHLARLTPPACATTAGDPFADDDFEALLERTDFEAAAVALIGTALSHEVLARSAEECAIARVRLDGGSEEALASPETLALALLGAWLEFMLALDPRERDQATGSSHKSA